MSETIVVSNYATLIAFGKTLKTSCIILDHLHGNPAYPEDKWGKPGIVAYQPQRFPPGIWLIGDPEFQVNPLTAPYFIPTDAHQIVVCVDGTVFDDWGYGAHADALYETTLGCLHLYSADDAEWLAGEIISAKQAGELIQLVVS